MDIRGAGAAMVTFEPGARMAWHIWFAPSERHWHGASPTAAMTHIAMQESLDGKFVDWMEKMTDDQYDTNRTAR